MHHKEERQRKWGYLLVKEGATEMTTYSPCEWWALTGICATSGDPAPLLANAVQMLISAIVVTALLSASSCTANRVDHLTAARAAEQSLHAACDEWSALRAKGEDASAAATKIKRSYEDFYAHARDLGRSKGSTNEIVHVATAVCPTEDIVSAGALQSSNGDKWSYVVWRDEERLLMTQWKREEWKTHGFRPGVVAYLVHQGGYSASLTIQPEGLASKFSVRPATWADPQTQQLLRVPYTLEGVAGFIEIRRTGDEWRMRPDRGVVAANGVWRPLDAARPDVRFAEGTTPNTRDPFTPGMRDAYTRFRRIHGGMDERVVNAAVTQLFSEFAKHNPRVFVPMVVDDLMRVAPADARTIIVLRRSLKEGWIDPIAVHQYLVQAGEPAKEHIDYLISQLDSGEAEKRIAAIRALGTCGAKAKAALPRLEMIVLKSNAPREDYARAYTIEHPMPEHVRAKFALDRIGIAKESKATGNLNRDAASIGSLDP